MSNNICIAIYGIGRCTSQTAKYIDKLCGLMGKHFEALDLVYAYYHQKTIDSMRTGEVGKLELVDKTLFSTKLRLINLTSGDLNIEKSIEYTKNNFPDPYRDEYFSLTNLMKQLGMIEAISSDYNNQSSMVLAIRDDLLFDPNTLYKQIISVTNHLTERSSLLTSCYYWNRGVCDRFFYGNISVFTSWAMRRESIYTLPQGSVLTAEILVKHWAKENKIDITCMPISLTRLRINGVKKREKHLFPFWRPVELFETIIARFKCITLRY